jgi:hypothetical protein
LLALLLLAPLVAGCSSAGDIFSRDADWFSRPGRLFIRNVSIDAPPLTPNRPVTAEDLVSAEGYCPGMTPPGAPGSVNLSNNERGDRVAVVTYLQGQRAGIYTFTAGRLSSIERAPQAEQPPKPAKSKVAKKKPAAT